MSGILGQMVPSASSLQQLYAVPAGDTVTARVIVTNLSAAPTSFRVSLAKDGEADDLKQYIARDRGIAANDTGSTIAFSLTGDDVVRVYSANGLLAFLITGLSDD